MQINTSFIVYLLCIVFKLRMFWNRAEHQLQGRGPRRTRRRAGEAAFHGGVLQSQRSAHPLPSLHRGERGETSPAEPQPIHATAGGIQRARPGRSVWRPPHKHWTLPHLIKQYNREHNQTSAQPRYIRNWRLTCCDRRMCQMCLNYSSSRHLINWIWLHPDLS